jgi:hypothetical protein
MVITWSEAIERERYLPMARKLGEKCDMTGNPEPLELKPFHYVKSTLQNIDLNAVDFNAFSECLKMDIGDS